MLSSVGVKAWSGMEDTTLLSMADCRVKQVTVSTATRYGIKPRIQGCPRGSVRMGGQKIRVHKKKISSSIDLFLQVGDWNGISSFLLLDIFTTAVANIGAISMGSFCAI